MARINIESSLLTDTRFVVISRKIGDIQAKGEFVTLAFLAQKHWGIGEKIPHNIYEIGEFSEWFVKTGLVEKHDDGYYLKGSEENFEWYRAKISSSSKGGKESAKRERDKKGRLLPKTHPSEVQVEPSEVQVEPSESSAPSPSPSPSPTLLGEGEQSALPPDVIPKTLEHDVIESFNQILGGHKSIKHFRGYFLPPKARDKFMIFSGDQQFCTIEKIQSYFEEVKESNFLTDGIKFRIDLIWLLDIDNAFKVISGRYQNPEDEYKNPFLDEEGNER